MNIFSIDFTVAELQLLRQSLDVITITGRDAKIISALQVKLETEIAACNSLMQAEQIKKVQEITDVIERTDSGQNEPTKRRPNTTK